MQKARVVCALIVLVVLGNLNKAEALRCENRIVSSGDTSSDVLFKCGTPTLQQVREEEIEVFEPVFIGPEKVLVARRIPITIEEWTYNFWPHNLLYVVKFENGRVVDIRTRGYGY
jgi:hypothetical protein